MLRRPTIRGKVAILRGRRREEGTEQFGDLAAGVLLLCFGAHAAFDAVDALDALGIPGRYFDTFGEAVAALGTAEQPEVAVVLCGERDRDVVRRHRESVDLVVCVVAGEVERQRIDRLVEHGADAVVTYTDRDRLAGAIAQALRVGRDGLGEV